MTNSSGTYDNTNSGMLADNQRRRTDRDPILQGSINIEGVEYWLSAWQNVGKEGSKLAGKSYLSIKAKKKDAQAGDRTAQPTGGYDWKTAESKAAGEAKQQAANGEPEGEFNDEIPFAFAFAIPFSGLIAGLVYVASQAGAYAA